MGNILSISLQYHFVYNNNAPQHFEDNIHGDCS
jgi:hypothetical protein